MALTTDHISQKILISFLTSQIGYLANPFSSPGFN